MAKPAQSAYAPITRARGQSLTNLLPPTDGREHDPLERWKGAPVMSWGVGGTFVTIFPRSIPRYAIGQTTPVTVRTVGEIKVQNIKDLDPLQDHLAKFPGPLKGKSKKKEAISWLSAGIEFMEKELPDVTFHSHLSLEEKRSIERLLLWKLLRVFVEHDGVLEGSPTVDKAVRQVLIPETAGMQSEGAPLFTAADTTTAVTSMQADGVDSGAIEKIRLDLLKGDRETAVWAAVDKRLWGHAMIISQTVSSDLYKRVAQEFVRKEVNYPGHNNESLAALYKVLSGNYDDCVDELVPSHARAGLQLVSTENSSGPTKDAMEGLDKWRETLTLVLSNRSNDDVRGLNALGKLLSSYGRAEAAHICFIFSRQLSVFGGLDDPKADFVLLGSDHHKQSDQFAKETEALQLSEVYEYGLTLAGGVTATAGAPHLAAYKLQHAVTLAEYGYRDRALQYCDAIASAIVSQTRRSAYHHPILEGSVEDFLARLKQAPKEASSSWISKPTMGKVSDSMWNRFNKFVSGDEDGNGQAGSDGDNGPFARIASSPNNSRPPSTSNFDVYASSPSFPSSSAPPAAGAAASRYAPAPTAQFPTAHVNPFAQAAQGQHVPLPNPTSSAQRYAPNPSEASYSGVPPAQPLTGGYQPVGYPRAAVPPSHQPVEAVAPHAQQQPAPAVQAPTSAGYRPYSLQEPPNIQPQPGADDADQGYQPPSYGYEPPQTVPDPVRSDAQGTGDSSGYEPPSFQPYDYEAPSYQAHVEGDDARKPKKKSFMEDDDEDIPALRQPQEKSKAEKDRENEELFRKAAEEDAKRAASTTSVKKGWGFGGWFGGGKKPEGNIGEAQPGKAIKAKLGEQSSFVYDPDLKRWINKKPGAENIETKKAAPPPPRGAPRPLSGTPPPGAPGTPPPAAGRSSVPPMPFRSTAGKLTTAQSMENLTGASAMGAPPASLSRSVSSNNTTSAPPSTGPPSRPATSMSNASSIDDLLGAPGPRKAGQKKARKSGRYVDVMAK
ncbi:vesicle coat component [Metarhizium acridum]|nr:vesicle coat component [Metarhizium acridum]